MGQQVRIGLARSSNDAPSGTHRGPTGGGALVLVAWLGVVGPALASPDAFDERQAPRQTQPAGEARSPYRWFILAGFMAGGLITAWRMRARRRGRSVKRG